MQRLVKSFHLEVCVCTFLGQKTENETQIISMSNWLEVAVKLTVIRPPMNISVPGLTLPCILKVNTILLIKTIICHWCLCKYEINNIIDFSVISYTICRTLYILNHLFVSLYVFNCFDKERGNQFFFCWVSRWTIIIITSGLQVWLQIFLIIDESEVTGLFW